MKSYQSECFSSDKADLCVYPDLCKGCGICVTFCPVNALELHRDKVVVARPEDCTGCGLCELRCPDFAIQAARKQKKSGEADTTRPAAPEPPTAQPGNGDRQAPAQPVPTSMGTIHSLPWPQPKEKRLPGPWGTKIFLQGNEASAEGAIYAGCRFFGGYPITPSTEVAEHLSARIPEVGGVFVQMEDEIGGLASAIGASLAGSKSFTSTSGPGFSLMQENLGFACHCEIPVVIINIMRGGPSTGLPTAPSQSDIQQARWGTHGDHPIIVLTPGNVEEMFSETVRAFNLSETLRVPVLIMVDEIIAHMRKAIRIPELGELEVQSRSRADGPRKEFQPHAAPREGQLVAPMARFGDGYRFHVTGLSFNSRGFPTHAGDAVHEDQLRKERKVTDNLAMIERNEEYLLDDAEVVVFAFGASALSARSAIDQARSRGIRAGMLRPLTIWPFPHKRIRDLSKNPRIRAIVVAEMNLGQSVLEVERAVAERRPVIPVLYAGGEAIKPPRILDAIMEGMNS